MRKGARMFKRIVYSVSFGIVLFLAGCKCPFCNCRYQDEKTQPAAATTQEQTHITITTQEQFKKEVLDAPMGVIVDFYADRCGACKASKPAFDAAAAQLGAKYKFIAIDVDKAEEITQSFGIQGVPTFMFFKAGKNIHRIIGAITNKETFISTIEKTFGK